MRGVALLVGLAACSFEPHAITADALVPADPDAHASDANEPDAREPDAGEFACPSGYTPRAARSCHRDVTTAVTWDAAEADCETAGAHLVVVDDSTEDLAVPDNRWIGYTERVTAGTFRWVTGVSTTFEGFAVGEPGTPGGASCVEARADGWHDDNCPELKAYTCEFDGRVADPTQF